VTDLDGGGDPTSTVYREAGFTGGFAWGDRPAVLVVDFSCGFTDPECPLGSDVTVEVERTRRLLDEARRRGVLVVFTTIAYEPGSRAATTWLRKVPSLGALTVGSAWAEIDPRLGRLDQEPVVTKTGASAFFGTAVHALLVSERIDTVLVLGATTSGCVRASVVDSVQHGFPTFVVTDCCADRAAGPHEANLFDMTAKYADACTAEEVVSRFQDLPQTVAG
jgi:nicotinamidase-related amidase